jgi:hypothetical protein
MVLWGGRLSSWSILLLACISVSCVGGQRQSEVIRQHSEIEASTTELRFEVVQLARCIAGEVEVGADAIRNATDDPVVRRDALLWKVNAIPEIHAAALQLDPFVAGMDLWAFLAQMKDFFETGAGAAAFGKHAHLAREAMERAEQRLLRVGGRVSSVGEGREPALIGRWAADHPLRGFDMQRESVGTKFAYSLRGAPHGGLAAIGDAQASMQRLEYRAALVSESMPKLVRWSAELAVDDMTGEEDIEYTLSNLNQTLNGVASLVDQLPEMLAAERAAVLDGITGERIAAFEAIERERIEAFKAISRERQAITLDLSLLVDHQRTSTMEDLDALVDRRVRSTIDFALLRAAQALGVLVLVGLVAFAFVRWNRPGAGSGSRPSGADRAEPKWTATHHPKRRAIDRERPAHL